jgi:uncharacterized Ntn-hydrolase superfamily protein
MTRPVHTYSIVARDPQTGQLGIAVQSHYFSVGSIVTWAEAGVGAVATQSFVRVDYGPEGLDLMRSGRSAKEALASLLATDKDSNVRQVAMVDAQGGVSAHTGELCIKGAGHIVGDQFSVQANLMTDDTIWPAMDEAYRGAQGDLASRLLVALKAAQGAGGDIRGQQSAALLIVSGERQEKPFYGRLFDLRVEDHPRPLDELTRLVQLRRAYQLMDQGDEYLTAHEFDKAASVIAEGLRLAPEITELKFWAAVSLLTAGREDEALQFFREVFAREPIWADLVPRLVPPGLLSDKPGVIDRILEQRGK